VVTLNGSEDETIEEYANKLYEKWGIGGKNNDAGALLLVFPDKRKVRIETGYGAEGFLPDLVCLEIIRKTIVPLFKAGENEKAVTAGYLSIVSVLEKEYKTTFQAQRPQTRYGRGRYGQPRKPASMLQMLIMLGIFILLMSTPFGRAMVLGMLLGSMMGGRRYGGGGFGGGGFGGGFGGFGGGSSGGGGGSGGW